LTTVTNDISFEGFQAYGASWVSFLGSRIFCILRAGNARLDVLRVDVSFTAQNTSATNIITVQCGPLQIWRCSVGQKDPPNVQPSFGVAPAGSTAPIAGFEQLFNKRINGLVYPNNFNPTSTTEMSFGFAPGVISAKAGQQLFVVVSQPVASTGGVDVYASSAATVTLSVGGLDYGVSPTAERFSNARSVPRF
jgi:hypothetical protein